MDARMQEALGDFATRRAARGFTFDDLAEVALDAGVDADELAAWLAGGCASGLLADLGSETLADGTVIGPRRYCAAAFAPHGGHACREGLEPDGEPRYWEAAPAPLRYR